MAILPEPTVAREVAAGTLVAVRIESQDPGRRLTRPLAIIHRRSHQLGLTASRFLELLTCEAHGAERRRRRGREMIGVGAEAAARPRAHRTSTRPGRTPDRNRTGSIEIFCRFEPLVRAAKDRSS